MSAETGVTGGLDGLMAGLGDLGWPEGQELDFCAPGQRPGRVSIVHGGRAEVIWFPDDAPVERSFQLRHDLRVIPVAGDWVAVSGDEIRDVRERHTCLSRPDPNGRDVQVLAANIDLVLIVLPIDRGLNPKNLERLSVMAWDSGAEPLVLLTKADAAVAPEAEVAEAERLAPGVEVILTSSVDGRGLDRVRARLGRGTTATMLGASGAGKTSLLNALNAFGSFGGVDGAEGADAPGGRVEPTREVRRDGAGRHTTTTRRLYRLAGGGVLLDLPGIRSLDLLAGDDAVQETFADIALLAQDCRFRDCGHDAEPGCAVTEAVESGTLEARRLASWRAIRRELAYLERRNDPLKMAAHRAEWKAIAKSNRHDKGKR